MSTGTTGILKAHGEAGCVTDVSQASSILTNTRKAALYRARENATLPGMRCRSQVRNARSDGVCRQSNFGVQKSVQASRSMEGGAASRGLEIPFLPPSSCKRLVDRPSLASASSGQGGQRQTWEQRAGRARGGSRLPGQDGEARGVGLRYSRSLQ